MPWALQDSLELCGATKGFSARTSRSQPRSCSEGVKDHIEGGLGDLWARHAPQLGCSHNLGSSSLGCRHCHFSAAGSKLANCIEGNCHRPLRHFICQIGCLGNSSCRCSLADDDNDPGSWSKAGPKVASHIAHPGQPIEAAAFGNRGARHCCPLQDH